jgi:hypothetical protein
MRVLVLETSRGASARAERALETAGHEVVRCHPRGQWGPLCKALEDGTCVLSGIDVALTVREPPFPRPAPLEDGALCALRSHVPLVVAGSPILNPFERWAAEVVSRGDDVVAGCERAATGPLREHSRLATEALRSLLEAHREDAGDAQAVVNRSHGVLRVTLSSREPLSRAMAEMAAVRVIGAVRELDPNAVGIDITMAESGRA